MYRKGCKAIWVLALATEARGISAGVAIVARKQLGLWTPKGEQPVVVKNRVCWVLLSACGLPRIMVDAAYLYDSEGPVERICSILEAINHHSSTHNLGLCVGTQDHGGPWVYQCYGW